MSNENSFRDYIYDFKVKTILIGMNCKEMREYHQRIREILDSVCMELGITLEEVRLDIPLPKRAEALLNDLKIWYENAHKRVWIYGS